MDKYYTSWSVLIFLFIFTNLLIVVMVLDKSVPFPVNVFLVIVLLIGEIRLVFFSIKFDKDHKTKLQKIRPTIDPEPNIL